MQTDIDELINVKLEDELVALLVVDGVYGDLYGLYRRVCCFGRSCLLFWSARLSLSSQALWQVCRKLGDQWETEYHHLARG
jgi:hypothetical protein